MTLLAIGAVCIVGTLLGFTLGYIMGRAAQ